MHLFIVNPVAGKKLSLEEKLALIEPYVKELSEPYEIYVTRGPMDACEKVRSAAMSGVALRVYSCGGDGTLNEVINGAYGFDNVEVTVFPCGTGNDFIKIFGDKARLFHDMPSLLAGKSVPIDIIDCNGRKCVNICSVGIDARIGTQVHKYSHIPLIGGAGGYIISLIVNIIKGISKQFEILINNLTLRGSYTLICACNGQYYGGFFHPVPEADPCDGLLDFLIVKKVSRLDFISLVRKYAQGRHEEMPKLISHMQSDHMHISGLGEIVINADGEALSGKNADLTIIPKAINFILPEGLSQDDIMHTKYRESVRK